MDPGTWSRSLAVAVAILEWPGAAVSAGPLPGSPPARTVAVGAASHYLGPDDSRPVNLLTGAKVEPSSRDQYMVDGSMFVAAMRGVPLDSRVRVTDLESDRSVVVRVHDRGPFKPGRVIDLTHAAWQVLTAGGPRNVLPRVRVELLPARTPLSGPDWYLTRDQWREIRAGRDPFAGRGEPVRADDSCTRPPRGRTRTGWVPPFSLEELAGGSAAEGGDDPTLAGVPRRPPLAGHARACVPLLEGLEALWVTSPDQSRSSLAHTYLPAF